MTTTNTQSGQDSQRADSLAALEDIGRIAESALRDAYAAPQFTPLEHHGRGCYVSTQPQLAMSPEQFRAYLLTSCGFAHPGTYGHECGAPATQVAVKRSTTTKSGIFYARRCDNCAGIRGGENSNVIRFEPFNPAIHTNEYR